MGKIFILLGLFSLGSANALCLNPFGCGPSDIDECRAEATKLPTERGVTVALNDCHQRFVSRPAEEIRKTSEKKMAARWREITESTTSVSIEKAKNLLGEPAGEGDWHACRDEKGGSTSDACKWYEWDSKKANPECYSGAFSPSFWTGNHMYRAEFRYKPNNIYRWYKTEVSTCNGLIDKEK